MVDIEELEDILHKEKIDEIYASIDYEELDRKEKAYKEWKEHTKKPLHPMSYEIEQELKERDKDGNWVGLTDEDVINYMDIYFILSLGIVGVWTIIGGLFWLYLAGVL